MKLIARLSILSLILLHPALLLVDHVHFQYNGILLGLLIITISFSTSNTIAVTLFFGILVLSKHLFVSLLPIFALVVLLQSSKGSIYHRLSNLFWPCLVAVLLLSAAFGPFLFYGGIPQLLQIFQRLFPFSRGLVHAYWAPNLWAFYVFVDKVLSYLSIRVLNLQIHNGSDYVSSSSGLVGTFFLGFLPQVSASFCLVLVLAIITAVSFRRIVDPVRLESVLRCTVFSSLTSFMLGYHVHEKAIIIPTVIQALLLRSSTDEQVFLALTLSSSISIFPLIPGPTEWIIKGKDCLVEFFLI